MRLFLRAAAIACVALYATSAWAANTFLIESKSVLPGETGVTVGVYVENDVALSAMNLPMETREIETGSYMQGPFTFVPHGRVAASGLMDSPIQLYFNTPDGGNSCSGPVSSTWSGGTAAPNANGVADAMLWVGQETGSPCLAPGSDGAPGSGTPSFLFTFDVTTVEGRFEIDTCCTSPSTHLIFVECGIISAIMPEFTKGVITIGEPVINDPPVALCRAVTVAASALNGHAEATVAAVAITCHADASIDDGSFDPDGGAPTLSQSPPGPYLLGQTLVTLMVTDDEGDTASCQATVTVVDSTPPVLTCLTAADTAVTDPDSVVWLLIDYTLDSAFQANDNCDGTNLIVSQNPIPGTPLGLGDQQVCVVVEDQSGNKDSCCFTVTVIDGPPPVCNAAPVDVNCDGVVDVLDVVFVAQSAFREAPTPDPCCLEP